MEPGTHLLRVDAFLTAVSTRHFLAVFVENVVNGVLEPSSLVVYFCNAHGHRFRVAASVATAPEKRFGCPKCATQKHEKRSS